MDHYKIEFDYVDSITKFPDVMLDQDYAGVIISDYPADNFTEKQLSAIEAKAAAGMGVLMIGGWESFTGLGGNYNRTVLHDILPVNMQPRDDRVNWWGPCVIEKNSNHGIIKGLSFENELPIICGYNLVQAKPNSVLVLSARRFIVTRSGNNYTFTSQVPAPLLVAGSYGKGRTAAFMSDFAPHWSGSLVDWGDKRIGMQAKNAGQVEVGNHYASFVANIIRWTSNLEF
jgi:uncharacterized membrane protein